MSVQNSKDSIVIEDGTINWDNCQAAAIQYINTEEVNLSDTIDESFVTAIGDNETHYLSVLETTNNDTLDDLHDITLLNSKTESQDNLVFTEDGVDDDDETVDLSKNQVIVFTMDGSNDLYGMQFAHDDEGNLQKYQFKFRTSSDGQLEAIPDSIELVNDEIEVTEQQCLNENIELSGQDQSENNFDFQLENDNGIFNDDTEEENITRQSSPEALFIKGEQHSPVAGETTNEALQEENEPSEGEVDELHSPDYPPDSVKAELLENVWPKRVPVTLANFLSPSNNVKVEQIIEEQQSHLVEEFQNENNIEYVHETLEQIEETSKDNHFENVVQYEQDIEDQKGFINTNQFEEVFVEETRIQCQMAPTNVFTYSEEAVYDERPSALGKTNILKKHSHLREIKPKKTSSNTLYYVIYPDKENVDSAATNSNTITDETSKVNPRSVLKNSYLKTTTTELATTVASPNTFLEGDERSHKRFARSKEVVEAKRLHNFINRTTITQAPVRKERLPRKQEIKPVNDRRDEEIIVQEVVLSSDGVIESIEDKLKNSEKLEVTAVVELTDSDDDSTQNRVLSLDSDSDASVIVVPDKHETKRASKLPVPTKVKQSASSQQDSEELSTCKKEIACPNCTKTFPSQNSLNTHIHHHNLENNLKRAMNKKSKSIQYKHRCDECKQTFINTILLRKHNCPKDSSKANNCNICLKQFSDVSVLNIHKRGHIKANLVKSTSIETLSPKKIKPLASGFKSLKKFTCGECSKVCSSDAILKIHKKTHKKFCCPTCSFTFSSRLLLDTHIRKSCVKPKSPASKEISDSLKTVECKHCKMKFLSSRGLFIHKVQKHGK